MKKLFSFILISFILFTNLVVPISVFGEETVWNYTETATQKIHGPFTTEALCVADRTSLSPQNLIPTSTCQSSIIAGLPIPKPDPAIPVTPKINVAENKSIYTMLAPIGGITRMDSSGTDATCAADPKCITNDIGKYLNIIFKLAIGVSAALAVIMLIINGITYMGDESIFAKTEAKSKMFSAILGLLIALGSWALLNTISPALTGKGGFTIDTASVVLVRDRADDPNFVNNISKFNTSNITPSSYSDPLFLGYMAHQQGSAGISAILWAEKNGLTEVPTDNPYTNIKSDINKNMKNNFISSDVQKVIGTSVLTPANFLKYWALKTAAAKETTTPPIFPSIDSELTKVANETGVDVTILRAICRIESAGGCTNESSITTVNSGGYSGLFQLSSSVFDKYKNKTKNKNILDAYDNALVAALYYKDNLNSVKR